MRAEDPPLTVRVISGDPLARGGLTLLLTELGLTVQPSRAAVAVWDLGAAGTPPELQMSADEPVLALFAEPAEARRALATGASGALPRDAAPEQIEAAIRALAADLVVLDDTIAAELLPAATESPLQALTRREQEVLSLLAEGLSNKDIGEALDISTHTARFHVRAILGKLSARNRAEAVAIAARAGLLVV